MFYHYTYLIWNKINKKKYIGVRTPKCLPKNDNYWGSCKTLTESIAHNGSYSFKKKVLAIWNTHKQNVSNGMKGVGLGERYYNNGIVIRRFVPRTEDVGFILGRKF